MLCHVSRRVSGPKMAGCRAGKRDEPRWPGFDLRVSPLDRQMLLFFPFLSKLNSQQERLSGVVKTTNGRVQFLKSVP